MFSAIARSPRGLGTPLVWTEVGRAPVTKQVMADILAHPSTEMRILLYLVTAADSWRSRIREQVRAKS